MPSFSNILNSVTIALATDHRLLGAKPYSQDALDSYNVLRFLGTASPYISNTGFGIDREAPASCNVTQASVIARHGERYPTPKKGKAIEQRLERIRGLKSKDISGPLSFLADYDYVALNEERYGSETDSGPYSGLDDMHRFGTRFRNRYGHLYDLVEDKGDLKFYTASEKRVVDSCVKFAEGFLDVSNVNDSSVVIIDEDDSTLGANSLTPSTSCHTYDTDVHDELVEEYPERYLEGIAKRFNSLSPELSIEKSEVKGLLDYIGFDLNVAGKNAIAELFTTSELIAYGYSNDLNYYYNKGPGNNMSAVVGSAFVNGMMKVLNDGNIPLTMSFAHDSDLFPIHSLFGLFDGDLPLGHIDFRALWKTSNITPMGGHIIFERLKCGGEDGQFLRIVVNDAVIPIPGLSNGPGFSASISDVEKYIQTRLNGRSYAKNCGLKKGVPTDLTFFWD